MTPLLREHPSTPRPGRILPLLVATPEGSSGDPSVTTRAITSLPGVLLVIINPRTQTALLRCDPRLVGLPRLHAAVTSAAAESGEREHEQAFETTG